MRDRMRRPELKRGACLSRRGPFGGAVPRVRLPFVPEWRPLVLSGEKTTTVRTRRYGTAGDSFEVEGVEFVLEAVDAMPLSRARELFWRSEGFASPAAFEEHWAKAHPTRGYRAADTVWVHRFRAARPDVRSDAG